MRSDERRTIPSIFGRDYVVLGLARGYRVLSIALELNKNTFNTNTQWNSYDIKELLVQVSQLIESCDTTKKTAKRATQLVTTDSKNFR